MSLRKFKPKYDYCLEFDGTKNISVPSSESLAFTSADEFTIIVSIKMQPADNVLRGICGTTNSGTTGYELVSQADKFTPRVTLRGSTIHDYFLDGSARIRTGEWERAAINCSSSFIRRNINGVYKEKSANAWVGGAGGLFYIGDRGSTGAADFLGKMQDLIVYPRILTTAELEADYFDGAVLDNPAAHWKMNEGSGTDLIDSSGNGLNATVTAGINYVLESSR